jgi:hypothetical protein
LTLCTVSIDKFWNYLPFLITGLIVDGGNVLPAEQSAARGHESDRNAEQLEHGVSDRMEHFDTRAEKRNKIGKFQLIRVHRNPQSNKDTERSTMAAKCSKMN